MCRQSDQQDEADGATHCNDGMLKKHWQSSHGNRIPRKLRRPPLVRMCWTLEETVVSCFLESWRRWQGLCESDEYLLFLRQRVFCAHRLLFDASPYCYLASLPWAALSGFLQQIECRSLGGSCQSNHAFFTDIQPKWMIFFFSDSLWDGAAFDVRKIH